MLFSAQVLKTSYFVIRFCFILIFFRFITFYFSLCSRLSKFVLVFPSLTNKNTDLFVPFLKYIKILLKYRLLCLILFIFFYFFFNSFIYSPLFNFFLLISCIVHLSSLSCYIVYFCFFLSLLYLLCCFFVFFFFLYLISRFHE